MSEDKLLKSPLITKWSDDPSKTGRDTGLTAYAIHNKVNAETIARINADEAEAADRQEADTAEATARLAAVDGEATARIAADESEAADRQAADKAEADARLTADNAEATARINADEAEASARRSAIENEAADRIAADQLEASTRTSAIDTEATARIEADSAEAQDRIAADQAEADERIAAIHSEAAARIAADEAEAAIRRNEVDYLEYCVNHVFAGATLPDTTNLNLFTTAGLFRITNNIGGTKPPIASVAGYLEIMNVDSKYDTSSLKNAIRVRQVLYPDAMKIVAPTDVNGDSNKTTTIASTNPYIRTGLADSSTGVISWSEWQIMGGGSLQRVVLSTAVDREVGVISAQPNVLYESFGAYTIVLPNASSVPVSTRIGVEQHTGRGIIKTLDGTYQQATAPETEAVEPADVTGPEKVLHWTMYDLTSASDNLPKQFAIPLTFTASGTSWVVSGYSAVVGTYVLQNSGAENQDRYWKHSTKDIYIWYDTSSLEWRFTSAYKTTTLIYAVAEMSFQTNESIVYMMECCLAENGTTHEWVLDADTNFSHAIAILSARMTDATDDNSFIKNAIIPKRGRRTQYFTVAPSNPGFRGRDVTKTNYEDYENLDVFDLEYYVVADGGTITLPTPRSGKEKTDDTFDYTLGAKMIFDIANTSSTIAYKTITFGVFTHTFTVEPNSILIAEFELGIYGSYKTWILLSNQPAAACYHS